jgi:hypothetical protein
MEEILNAFLSRHSCPFEVRTLPASGVDEIYQDSPATIYIVYPSAELVNVIPYVYEGHELNSMPGVFANTEDLIYRDGNKIYLQFLVDQLPTNIVDKLLLQSFNDAIRETSDAQSYQFEDCISSAVERRLVESRQNIRTNEENARRLESELLSTYLQISFDKKAVEALDQTKYKWKKAAERDYSSILKLVPSHYKRIEILVNEIRAYTHTIYIVYEGSEYLIGDFCVMIEPSTGTLTIDNLTNKLEDRFDHPHVDNGHPCLGNAEPGILKMLSELELFGVLEAVYRFLHSYNADSPYVTIEHYDPEYEDNDDKYNRCHEDNSGFDCVRCGDDSCPFYQDAFEDCYEGSTYEDCVHCEYLCHYGRRRIREHEEEEKEG